MTDPSARDPSGRHERAAELFAAALELEADARFPFLERECANSPGMVNELLALLSAHDVGGDLLDLGIDPERLAGLLQGGAPSGGEPPGRVGPYRIVRELGRGGMGTVYLAERDDGHYEQRGARSRRPPGRSSGRGRRRREYRPPPDRA